MVVRCIDDDLYFSLTIGKEYEVIKEKAKTYVIVDNTGTEYRYRKELFEKVTTTINQEDILLKITSMEDEISTLTKRIKTLIKTIEVLEKEAK